MKSGARTKSMATATVTVTAMYTPYLKSESSAAWYLKIPRRCRTPFVLYPCYQKRRHTSAATLPEAVGRPNRRQISRQQLYKTSPARQDVPQARRASNSVPDRVGWHRPTAPPGTTLPCSGKYSFILRVGQQDSYDISDLKIIGAGMADTHGCDPRSPGLQRLATCSP